MIALQRFSIKNHLIHFSNSHADFGFLSLLLGKSGFKFLNELSHKRHDKKQLYD
ncbi:hypothetical protein [Thermodesulfovibrio hydrogeniphilus]